MDGTHLVDVAGTNRSAPPPPCLSHFVLENDGLEVQRKSSNFSMRQAHRFVGHLQIYGSPRCCSDVVRRLGEDHNSPFGLTCHDQSPI